MFYVWLPYIANAVNLQILVLQEKRIMKISKIIKAEIMLASLGDNFGFFYFYIRAEILRFANCRGPPNQSLFKNLKIDLEVKTMAYNKGKAEKEWKIWKEAEEKTLHSCGWDESSIKELHDYDWEEFKANRCYYEKLPDDNAVLDFVSTKDFEEGYQTVQDLLGNIKNKQLREALLSENELTLQILIWKMEGYKSADISEKCGLSVNAINFRMFHLREKLKKLEFIKKILKTSNI